MRSYSIELPGADIPAPTVAGHGREKGQLFFICKLFRAHRREWLRQALEQCWGY
jgi:hypothetical protein